MISYRSIALKISTVFQQTCSFSTTHGSITQLIGDRSVIKISGDNVLNFLQGLLTNDITPLSSPLPPPIYTCLLNAQGRHLHDMFLYKHQPLSSNNMNADQPTTLLADIDSLSLPNALQLLKRYRLRQQIDIEDVSDQYSVWVQYGNKNCADNSNNNNNNSMSDDKALLAFTEQWHNDPRLAALGRRAILDRSIQFTSSSNNIIGSKQQYQEWRYMHGVAEGSLEITPNQAISLEYSIDGLNGISFTKGCYIGQELMARTHYKGVVRKRVVPFEIVGGNDSNSSEEEEGDCKRRYRDVVRVGSGEKVGKVVQVCDKYGLALLQLRKVMKEGLGGGEEGGGCMLNMTNVGEDGVQPVAIRAYRPEWWPESWGREEQ